MANKKHKKISKTEPSNIIIGARLRDVTLLSCNCARGDLRPNQLPLTAVQSFSVGSDLPKNTTQDTLEKRYLVALDLILTYDPAVLENPPVKISASLMVQFDTDPQNANLGESEWSATAASGVWPYWIEFVRTITGRMGLPTFPLSGLGTGQVALKAINKEAPK